VLLPAPFGPRKPDDLSLVDVKTDVLHGAKAGIGFGEIFDLDHGNDGNGERLK